MIRLLIMFIMLASPAWAQWVNEPTSSTQILDCSFSSVSGCGILDAYGTSSIVTDATAPISASNVVKSTLSAGQTSGGMQLNYLMPSVYREMYVGLMWRTNPEFQGRTVGNKTFFMRGTGSNGVFLFGDSALVNGSASMIFGHNTGGLDNSHVCARDFGLLCFPNVGSGTLSVGVWTKLEAYIKCSTSNTSRDGIVRWWINGALAGNYTTLNYCAGGLNEWAWAETWDGFVNPPPTTTWNHFLDHLHISIPGGGATPPVDSPAGAPGSVTVTVTVP